MIFQDGDKIVFAGDSVTDAGSSAPVSEAFKDNLGFGYVRMVDIFMNVWYPELKVRVVNSGIGGNDTRNLLARFQTDVVDQNADWVSICIGINDVWRQFDMPANESRHIAVDEYESNLEKMICMVKDNVKGMFILTPYYIEPNAEDEMRALMDKYGEVCKKLAKKYNCVLVDFQKIFSDYCKYRHSTYVAWDRVHPGMTGGTLMAREFLKYCGFDFSKIAE